MSKHAQIEDAKLTITEAAQPAPALTPLAVLAPIDLPVATEDVRGGGDGGTCGSSSRLNHNEPTEADQDEAIPVLPADLPVADEASGPVSGGTGPSTYGGSPRLNHNELLAADSDGA